MNRLIACRASLLLILVMVSPVFSQSPPKLPMEIYVLDFGTNIKGDLGVVASDLSAATETAFSRRRQAFRVLERKNFNDIVRQNQLEADVQAIGRGQKPSQKFIQQMKGADGFVRGELVTRVDGVVLTVSLTLLNSEKIWQGQARHSQYEWLSGDIQKKEAEALAADAAASLLPSLAGPVVGEDGPRGMDLAKSGRCDEAVPLLQSAASIDTGNAELYFWIGSCQNRDGDFETASRTLTSGISRNFKRADMFTERARSFVGQKLYSRALEDLDQSLRLDPRSLNSIELRGDVAMLTGRYSDAVSAYDEVYQLDPTRARCLKVAEAHKRNGASNPALERSCASLP
jgi:tetratricopeptide (TPR) repeat protein